MYHISKSSGQAEKGRWVLLEHLPPILSPRVLLLVFLYAMAFTLLLLGLKMLRLEHKISNASRDITSNQSILQLQDTLLYQQESSRQIQQSISSQIIRLHVIANSDSDSDQALKLKVRDGIIRELQQELKDAASVTQAREIIQERIPQIQKKAQEIILQEGSDDQVTVSLDTRYFPVKVYGDLSFPAGDYEALCLEIGKASGHNWWCVLFPALCFVDETYAVVPEESKEKLKESLSQQEYDSLETEQAQQDDSQSSVEFHSAVYDWITGR